MIPKILHYCWFGYKKKPKYFNKCFESWQKYCPNYKIIEWNENNSKPYQNKFYRDAIRKKKYAFASDCIRSKILCEIGGVYLDTDMLLLKSIDELLKYNFFTGFEVEKRPAFGLFGAIPKHRLLNEMDEFYVNIEFNEFSLPVITHIFKKIISKENLKKNEVILPIEYFYPFQFKARNENYSKYVTNNTIAVHLWENSWEDKSMLGYRFYFSGLITVLIDFFFYGYSKKYFIRYFRGFSRKIYHLLKSRL